MLAIGATPLMSATSHGDVDSVKLLLEYDALVDLSNMYGVTPFLLGSGVNFSFVPTRGRFRTEEQTLEILQLLIDAGADINAISGNPTLRPGGNDIPRTNRLYQLSPADRGPDVIEGKNALHGAARHGWLKVAKFLIDNGVKQQLVDDSGRTPLDYAKGLYPPAFNDSQAEPNEAMIQLLTEACEATDNCSLELGLEYSL
jgi:ankyrin repeat protein